jgi:hypothetical protein
MLALALSGFVVRKINKEGKEGKKVFTLASQLNFTTAELADPIDEEDFDVSPEVTRELLLSALRLLARERENRSGPRVKEIIVGGHQPCMPSPPPPCGKDAAPEEVEPMEGPEEVGPTGRRAIVATATRLAKNPYTGRLHYIYYPVVYPTIHRTTRPTIVYG